MRYLFPTLLMLLISHFLLSQSIDENSKFFLGLSYGTSFSLNDFADTNLSNPDAGFAKDGRKIDLFGGIPHNNRLIITGVLRYQSFGTEITNLLEVFNAENPGADFSGNTEDWQTFYLLVGLAYRVPIGKRFSIYPRFGLGPLIATNPGITISSPNTTITNNFSRTSASGIGFCTEFGIGLQSNLGKHFSLMPTFAFSGGIVTIKDVITTTDNVIVTADYQPVLQTFNLGLSLAYRFY